MENSYDLNTMSWDELFLRHVYLIGSKSRDISSKLGSVIIRENRIIGSGYNGLPQHVDYDINERHDRPLKYSFYEHSERNSLYNCAREGISTKGAILITNGIPCVDCARGVIQSGIKEVCYHKQWQDKQYEIYEGKWTESLKLSWQMFMEAGVRVRGIDMFLGLKTKMNYQLIEV